MTKIDLKKCSLEFTKGTVYKDLRDLGGNAYRDIKMSLTLGSSSDLVYYLKDHSKLLKDIDGNEIIESICRGMFSHVYLVKDNNGKELVIKRSHDGWIPLQLGQNIHIPIPRFVGRLFFPEYNISPTSLERDVYDYEKIVKPFWGKKRSEIESKKFTPYLNLALHMIDEFIPKVGIKEIYSKEFWKKFIDRKKHSKLSNLVKYIKSVEKPAFLIPSEERYIVYDAFTNSLQTIFIQEAMRGDKDIIPGKKMAFPFELISEGVVPREMPRFMIEHLIRTIEVFIMQLDLEDEVQKVPDFRPLDSWKALPPTPYEIYIAETNNLVVFKNKKEKINVSFVDTHLLLEPEGNLIYRWIESRYWISLFANLRFWVRKALELSE